MRSFALLACFAVAFTAVALGSQPPANTPPAERSGRPEGRGGAGGPRDTASVEGAMKGVNRAVRQLRRDVGDGSKREENLRSINEAQRGLVAAKGQELPESYLASAADEKAKGALRDEYRRGLIAALRKAVDIEQAIFDAKPEEAKKMLEELAAMRDEEHKKLGVDEE